MSSNTKFGSGIDLTPITNDPANPVKGAIYYFDGTNRAEGLWVYNGTGFEKSGDDPIDERTLVLGADFNHAETGKTNQQNLLLADDAADANEVMTFFNVPAGASGMGSTLTFDYTMDNLTGVSGTIEIYLYAAKVKADFPTTGSDLEIYDASAVQLIGTIDPTTLTANGLLQTASVTLNAVDFSNVGGYDLRGHRAAIVLTAPYTNATASILPASANLQIKTVDLTGNNPNNYAWSISAFNKTSFTRVDAIGGNFAESDAAVQMGFTITTADQGDIVLDTNSIGSGMLRRDSVNGTHIKNGSITRALMAENSVSNAQMTNNSVGSDELQTDSVGTTEIQNDAVTIAKIADGTIESVAATKALDNLTSPTAVNQDLIPATDSTSDLGSSSKQWAEVYADEYRSFDPIKLISQQGEVDRPISFNVPSVYVREKFLGQVTLSASQTNTIWYTIDSTAFDTAEISYRLKTSASNMSQGTLRVLYNGTSVVISTVETENGATGVTFGAQMNGTTIELTYSSGADSGDLYPDLKLFQNAP